MFSAMRRRLHFSPATVIAGLALVFAMTGGAYAAKKYLITSTKQISPSVLKSLRGEAGANGVAGAAGAQGLQGPAGPAGPAGNNGANGEKGLQGEKGAAGVQGIQGKEGKQGATGATGTSGFTSTLPSGKTETGAWSIYVNTTGAGGPLALASISFPIPLAAPGEKKAFFFTAKQVEKKEFGSTGCSGTAEAPTAPAGVLCVYAAFEHFENTFNEVLRVRGALPTDLQGYATFGAFLNGTSFEGEPNAPALIEADGSWAVTAP